LQVQVLSALQLGSCTYARFGRWTSGQLDRKTSFWKVVRVARKVIDEPSEDIVANARKDRGTSRGPFGRLALFIRQVLIELRKVVTPTRKELVSYTGVVLVFVVIMMALVYGLDLVFAFAVNFVFGKSS
jgi:preprotein translocase subunit SecE